jgi:hypothetical protein
MPLAQHCWLIAIFIMFSCHSAIIAGFYADGFRYFRCLRFHYIIAAATQRHDTH